MWDQSLLLCSPILFHEKLNQRKILSCVVVAIGLLSISQSIVANGMHALGLLIAGMSALSYAALIVVNKNIIYTGGMQTASIELDVAAIVTCVYVFWTSSIPSIMGNDIPYLVTIGIVNTGLAYFLYFSSLQKLSGQSVALLSYLDPVSALCFSALLLNAVMTPLQLCGAALIIGGAILGEWRDHSS